jgi:hypothetical protein
MSQPPYPYITCDTHGIQKSYIVCVHVAYEDASTHHHQPCSETSSGEIMCYDCSVEPDLDKVIVVCEQSAKENGWTKTRGIN